MSFTEEEFIMLSENVVKDIAKTCSQIPEISAAPLLNLAMDIEEEIYLRCMTMAGSEEIWQDWDALNSYQTMCINVIESIPKDKTYCRRLCSARPAHIVDKYCCKKAKAKATKRKFSEIQLKVDPANAQRLMASKNLSCEPKRAKVSAPPALGQKRQNKSPTSVADIHSTQPLTIPNSANESNDICYPPVKNAMLPPPSKPLKLRIVHKDKEQRIGV